MIRIAPFTAAQVAVAEAARLADEHADFYLQQKMQGGYLSSVCRAARLYREAFPSIGTDGAQWDLRRSV